MRRAPNIPHLDRIQSSFGHEHNLSRITAHVGGVAEQACDTMGAAAYAIGDAAVYGKSPSLHVAAHEAAHLIQQQQGVQLYGGVGEAGDQYERHADEVADAVERGESAAELLVAADRILRIVIDRPFEEYREGGAGDYRAAGAHPGGG